MLPATVAWGSLILGTQALNPWYLLHREGYTVLSKPFQMLCTETKEFWTNRAFSGSASWERWLIFTSILQDNGFPDQLSLDSSHRKSKEPHIWNIWGVFLASVPWLLHGTSCYFHLPAETHLNLQSLFQSGKTPSLIKEFSWFTEGRWDWSYCQYFRWPEYSKYLMML